MTIGLGNKNIMLSNFRKKKMVDNPDLITKRKIKRRFLTIKPKLNQKTLGMVMIKSLHLNQNALVMVMIQGFRLNQKKDLRFQKTMPHKSSLR